MALKRVLLQTNEHNWLGKAKGIFSVDLAHLQTIIAIFKMNSVLQSTRPVTKGD